MSHESSTHPAAEAIDIKEYGAPKNGVVQVSERRLYVQLQVYTGCSNPDAIIAMLQKSPGEYVLYLDVNDPKGIGILAMTEDPDSLVRETRCFLNAAFFSSLTHRPELTMLGRTYSNGREPNLEDWLLHKPRRNALNPDWRWAVWYPLRRKPEFELLPKEEQGKALYEHAKIGIAYGLADMAHDIRLACYGLDQNDNEFVLGLVGKDLYPLSRVVQEMRKTQQTARYMQSLGPFFIGKAIWQSPIPVSSARP